MKTRPFVFLAGVLAGAAGVAQTPPADAASLKSQSQALDDELGRELRRVQQLLTYVDQAQGMRIAQGTLNPQQAAEQLAKLTATLYRQGIQDMSLGIRMADHSTAADAFFDQIEKQIGAATRWPGDKPGQDYRALAKTALDEVRRQFAAQQKTPLGLYAVLSRAVQVLGWARGEAAVPPGRDPFAQGAERVISALTEEHGRHVTSLALEGTSPASAPAAPRVVTPQAPARPAVPPAVEPATRGVPTQPAKNTISSTTVTTLPTDATGAFTLSFPPDDSPVVAIPPKTPPTVRTPPAPPIGRAPAASGTPVPDDLTAARAALEEGRVAEARTAFAAAAQRDPQSAEAALGLGDSASLAGDLGVAMSSYLNVARLAPDTPNLQVAIAEVFLARGNARSARQWLESEVKLRPGAALAWSWLGTVQLDGGERENASASMARAASIDREVTALRFKHGVALLNQNQAKRAAAEFTAALMLDPRGTGAHYYLAECQARLGERAKAIESLGRYLQADSTSEWAAKARQRIEELGRAR